MGSICVSASGSNRVGRALAGQELGDLAEGGAAHQGGLRAIRSVANPEVLRRTLHSTNENETVTKQIALYIRLARITVTLTKQDSAVRK